MKNKQKIFIYDHLFPQISSEEQFQTYVREHPEFDPEYILQHCYIPRKETRNWIESIWEKYEEYAEPNLLTHIREPHRFHPFTWQIYLASVLLDNSYQLQPNNGSGPDLQINTKNGNVWIEATVTTAGDDESANGLPQSGAIYDALDPRVARISNALTKKYKIYKDKYLGKICTENEPFIIAINGSETYSLQTERAAEAAVYARGNEVIKFLPNGESQGGFYELRESITIQKEKGPVTINTNYFCSDAYKEISALIYCEQHIINANNHGRTPESNLYFLINPYAKNKIDLNTFTIGKITKMNETRQIIREYEKI